jgi:hypothetical protein
MPDIIVMKENSGSQYINIEKNIKGKQKDKKSYRLLKFLFKCFF